MVTSLSQFIRNFFDSLSLSGGILFLLSLIMGCGIILILKGHAEGEDIFKTAFTAFTTFIVGKKISDVENIHKP